MKKIAIIALAALPVMGFAQKAKIQNAWRALNDYENTLKDKPDVSYLMKAKENIDLALANEETKNSAKAYAYKTRIMYDLYHYNLMQEDKKLEGTIADKNARLEAAYGNTSTKEFQEANEALDKIQSLDPKYFENIINVMKGGEMPSDDDIKLATAFSMIKLEAANIATGKYKMKQFGEAAEYFYKSAYMNTQITGKKDTASFYNACIAAQKAKDYTKMYDYNKKMIDSKIASPYNYQTIYDAKLALKDTAGAMEYLKAGRKAFPNDVYLMNRETEIYLQKGNQEQALKNLQAAIDKDPNNAQLQLVLGNVYDNIANPKGKSGKDTTKPANFDEMIMKAAEHYQKAIDLKPDNQESYYNALYNQGALYNNYGGYLYNKSMEKSTLTDLAKKQKEFEAQSQVYYKKAIPYLEQALGLKPNDKASMYALRKLYLMTGEEAKGKEMGDRLKAGGK
ncbi:MAG: tetratricopeptide repeat protein [Bacteroidetes bacterium]|nr:tetratricopeptide repeat protein [Bacteroidota bacterium]